MDRCIRIACISLALALTAVAAFAQGAPDRASPDRASPDRASPDQAAAVDETSLVFDATAVPGAETPADSSIFPYVIRMILVLALILGCIYGLYALIKRSGKPGVATDSYLRVLASTPLAVGRNLHVVALGERAWLVGSTDASVSLIAEVADKELIDALALRAAEAPQAPRKDFGAMLMEMLGRKNAKAGFAPRSGDFLSGQRDRLRKF